jgi:hypothetical protein
MASMNYRIWVKFLWKFKSSGVWASTFAHCYLWYVSLIFKCSLSLWKLKRICFNLNIVIDTWTLDVLYVNIFVCDVFPLECIVCELGVLIWWCLALIGEVMWPCKPSSHLFEEAWRSNSETCRSQNKSAYTSVRWFYTSLTWYNIVDCTSPAP